MAKRTKNEPYDAMEIDLADRSDVLEWLTALHCTERELRDAVRQVGPSAADVLSFLNSIKPHSQKSH